MNGGLTKMTEIGATVSINKILFTLLKKCYNKSMGILDAFYSLGNKTNKTGGRGADEETEEGVVSDKFPELKLSMDNDELLKLTEKWEKNWKESEVYSTWIEQCEENENYWKGEQFNQPRANRTFSTGAKGTRQLMDNVIFESLETYLPQVTRRNPDPMVMLSRAEKQTPENLLFATNLQKELAEVADEIVLRLKMKKAARHWAIYLLGAMKIGWNLDKDIPTAKVIRPKKLILDPDSTVDEDGYHGKFIGEYRKLSADEIINAIEVTGGESGAVELIKKMVLDNDNKKALGTDIQFIEWWTAEYLCWTLASKQVLLKRKNPHWNYDKEVEAQYTDQGEQQLNEDGTPLMDKQEGVNHIAVPGIPFVLLSVFNLGKQPVDETSLIGQNLSSQDLVNKRVNQIDKNADSMNNGMVVSLERSGLTQQQASQVTEALRRGGVVTVPTGSVQDAVGRMSAPSLPAEIYNQLIDTRVRMRDVFGVSGSSSAGLSSEKTVRGKLQNRVLDTDRIGGGFSEYLEQMADGVYNWFVQMYYVYDERYLKPGKPKVRVSVKEGSLLPKDSTTLANQAIELAGGNRMALIDLYKALDYPNPEETAANVWLEANAPEVLFTGDERVQQVIKSRQEAQSGGNEPSKSISFKDLPPEGQAQLAKQAGLELHPEAIAAYNDSKVKEEVARNVAEEAGKAALNENQQPNS